jgi:RNA polymerase sigma-70 factor (ECF subfamily)
LIQAAQAGDTRAFGALYDRYQNRLESLARVRAGRFLRELEEDIDITQIVWLRAYRSLGSFRWTGSGSFFRWLGGILEHVVQQLVDYYKRRIRDPGCKVPFAEELITRGNVPGLRDILRRSEVSPSRAFRQRERLERLTAALERLPDEDRQILADWMSGYRIKDIAARVGCTPDAMSMRLPRIFKRLRSYFGSTDSLSLPPMLPGRGEGSGAAAAGAAVPGPPPLPAGGAAAFVGSRRDGSAPPPDAGSGAWKKMTLRWA